MIRRNAIFVYWILLLASTLVVGGMAWRFLGHENERLRRIEEQAVRSQAEILAASVEWAVRDVEDAVMRELSGLPPQRLREELVEWERRDPLIRNVFIWNPPGTLLLPAQEPSCTQEEKAFALRFAPLFSGQIAWERPAADPLPADSDTSPSSSLRLSRSRAAKFVESTANPSSGTASGWIPWFHENRLHLLCWIRRDPAGPIYGAEIEWIAVLSRLGPLFSEGNHGSCTMALVDGEEYIVFQAGDAEQQIQIPSLSTPIGALLPHWKINCYTPSGNLPFPAARNATLMNALLLGIFIVGLLSGATLLMMQARSSVREARQKTTFVSNVSHELKTPLTTIRMYAEMLEAGRVPTEEKKKKYLDVIVSESQRLTRLVNNVLDFSRLEQHRKKYRIEPVVLGAMLEALVEQQRPRCDSAGIKLVSMPVAVDISVQVDRDALEQTLLNLIDNAVKYAANGKVVELNVQSLPAGGVEISVMDRGPGVPHSHEEKIFEKFHRVDDSITAGTPGCGLGLSIARHMMRDMGGDVVYEPRAGGGAVFKVIIGV